MALTEQEREKVEQYILMYDPSFLEDSLFNIYLEDAILTVSANFFGNFYYKALALYMLHSNTYNKNTDADGGIVASKTIGPVSVTYNTSRQSSNNEFVTTKYGRMYEDLKKSSNITVYRGCIR